MRARIVERLHHSGPTVSQTVSRMERDGLLSVAPDRSLQLTPAGRDTAVSVMRSTAWPSGCSRTWWDWTWRTCTRRPAAGST